MHMPRRLGALILVALPLAAALTMLEARIAAQPPTPPAQPAPPAPPALSSSGLQLDALDRTADACTDFYQFACGAWMAKNPVPADRSSWGRFDELQERNHETLRKILDAAASGGDPGSKKIGDYYASCMDETAINTKGAAPLGPLLTKIAALTSANALAPLVAELHTIGVNPFFSFGAEADFKDASVEMAIADQGGMGLPDRDYYFRDDAKSVELRKQYVEHIGKMSALLGDPAERAAAAAQHTMKIETALAKAALDVVSRRDPNKIYHKLSVAELQALTPSFSGSGTSPASARRRSTRSTSPSRTSSRRWARRSLRRRLTRSSPICDGTWRTRRRLCSRRHSSTRTSGSTARTLTGAKELRPRWKRCVQYTDDDLGEALGQAFVKEAFGPQAKADTLKMVHELEAALETDIHGLAWMTEATQKAGARQAPRNHEQDRVSGAMARLHAR